MAMDDDVDAAWEALDYEITCEEEESAELPYAGELPPLEPGSVITVEGAVLPHCERFSVNLCCAEGDLALHLNPRVSQRYVVRTSRLGGRWGREETASCAPFPFARGKPFKLHIFVADDAFHCQVDENHFCSFPFRTPVSRVTSMEVRGSAVQVESVRQGAARSYPAGAPPPLHVPLEPQQQQPTWGRPALGVLPSGLARGQQIVIAGRVHILPHSFYVNLQSSVHIWPHPDIPLHLNPRFMAANKYTIIRNAWQNGSWGTEERTESSQLLPGGEFELRITCEEQHFSVWVGGSLLGSFSFRLAPACVRAVLVQGDVTVYRILQREAPSRDTTTSYHEE